MPRPTVDPRWGQRMRSLRVERGLTLRQLGQMTSYSHTYLWELETGRKPPHPELTARVDEALCAEGALAAAVPAHADPLSADDAQRLARVNANPRTADPATVTSLRVILDHQRRLEDAIGSGPLTAPTVAQLRVIEVLVDEVRGSLRQAVMDVAAQWAQFAGWLHAASGHFTRAREWYARTLEWATEVGSTNMIATALNLRGHLAWQARRPVPLMNLSAAALRQPASPGVRALAAQQEARGHALVGEVEEVERRLDQAVALAASAAEHPDAEPPWTYFYSGDYLTMQRGLAYRLLGRNDRAIEHLAAGLAALPTEMRRSEWVGSYLLQLSLAHADAGNDDEALRTLDDARSISGATGSTGLARQTERLAQRLGV